MAPPAAVIVTGASRGIGAATVERLLRAGAHVAAVARTPIADRPQAGGPDPVPGRLHPIVADVATPSACARIVEETIDVFGRLNGLVNNAGILEPLARIADSDPDRWRHNLDVNLLGPFYLCRWAIPHLRRTDGRIVNVSSGAAVKAIQGWSAYCVAKAALTHFTRQLAVEEPAITSVALRPGVVDTAMQNLIRRNGGQAMTADQSTYFQELKAKGKLLPADEPARAVAWLALSAPTALSGQFVDYDDPRLFTPDAEVFGP